MAEHKGFKAVDSIGHHGENVALAVRTLRLMQRLTLTELSQRVAENGRHIPELGLRRIEQLARRVDVDDLMALATALNVSPWLLTHFDEVPKPELREELHEHLTNASLPRLTTAAEETTP